MNVGATGLLMAETSRSTDREKTRIMLGLLDSVERGSATSQRNLASELGIALGLVNAYLKRCVRKGLVKVRQAPARRYAYYLTPSGFAEKSRLTVEYMSYSFSLFRRAKTDCMAALAAARERGFARVALLGVSDLAEVAMICALDSGVTIVAVIDPDASVPRFAGAPVAASLDDVAGPVDAVLVTDMRAAGKTAAAAIARCGADRVFVPALLGGLRILDRGAA
jgi:DNA-binding MarR family transcriptional regulator